MRHSVLFSLLCCLLCSCTSDNDRRAGQSNETITDTLLTVPDTNAPMPLSDATSEDQESISIAETQQSGDTTIKTIDILDLSTEGGEGKLYYLHNKLVRAIASLYGCGGQSRYFFNPGKNVIDVKEISLIYSEGLGSDIDHIDSLNYNIDYNGKILGPVTKDSSEFGDNLFLILKEHGFIN